MNPFIKKIFHVIVISSLVVDAHAFKLNCMNDTTAMEIEYGQHFDTVKVKTMAGKDFSFTTKLKTKDYNTRCGTELHQSAGLYNTIGNVFGYVKLMKFGEICTGQIVANIHLQFKNGFLDEKMACEFGM